MDCSTPGFSVHGIMSMERVAMPFSRNSSWIRELTQVSHIAGILYWLSHQKSPKSCISKGITCLISRLFPNTSVTHFKASIIAELTTLRIDSSIYSTHQRKSCWPLQSPCSVPPRTPLAIARCGPLPAGFSRQENWSGMPFLSLYFTSSLAFNQCLILWMILALNHEEVRIRSFHFIF